MGTRPNPPEFLMPGTIVQVRPWSEIVSTLDENGTLESLPFMPEMVKYCGRRFMVSKRVERACEEIEMTMRRVRNSVFLENIRCDGSAHGGCQKGCFLFWKEAWLRRVDPESNVDPESGEVVPDPYPFPVAIPEDRYICQATELLNATSYLPAWDLGVFLRDIRAKTHSFGKLIRLLSYAMFLRVRRLVTGKSHLHLEGNLTQTPTASLNLKTGEWVRVKSREEILKTLDKQGKNRGLAFTIEMLPFCGGTYRVLGRLEKAIHEPTRRLIDMKDTVILDQVTCDGSHSLRGGCPRENYLFWREIWLQRV